MDQMAQRLVDQVFQGRDTVSKGELVSKAKGMGLPEPVMSPLRDLPNGQVSRSQVEQKLNEAEGDLGGLRKAI